MHCNFAIIYKLNFSMKAKSKNSELKVNDKDLINPEKNSSSTTKKKIIIKKKTIPKVTPTKEKEIPKKNSSTKSKEKKTTTKKSSTKSKSSEPNLDKLSGSVPNPLNIRKSKGELKYKYPEGLSKSEMKKHRVKLRKELKSLQDALLKLTQGTPEFDKKSKELEKFLQTNYNL